MTDHDALTGGTAESSFLLKTGFVRVFPAVATAASPSPLLYVKVHSDSLFKWMNDFGAVVFVGLAVNLVVATPPCGVNVHPV